jgi:hypothetical protein
MKMAILKDIVDKHNLKKSHKMYDRIKREMGESTSGVVVVAISTDKGYDRLFDRLKEDGYTYQIDGNNREGLWLTVKDEKKRGLII